MGTVNAKAVAAVTVTLRIEDQNGRASEAIGQVSEEDADKLRQFVDLVQRVREATLVRRGIAGITNINWTAESGIEIVCAPYTDAELHELLHVLRPVILQNERFNFDKTSALLKSLFRSKDFAGSMKSLRHIYENGELSSYMQIAVGKQMLFHQSLLHTYLNGAQYHLDRDKAAAWRKLQESLSTDSARALVMNQLVDKVKALFHLQDISALVLRKIAGAQP